VPPCHFFLAQVSMGKFVISWPSDAPTLTISF
jgi:hypothetical protein